MRVLVACEESQAVTKAFRSHGHEAYSCDIVPCSGEHPEWHIQGNALKLLSGGVLKTCDDVEHFVEKWDLLIAHPPCTYLTNAGAVRIYKRIDGERYVNLARLNKGLDAKDFFLEFLNAPIDKIAVENPVPAGVFRMPQYTQIIQPYEYGDPYSKRTCLWLKNLPNLVPTNVVDPICPWISAGSKKADGTQREKQGMTFRDSFRRSKTFPGIAEAMAVQWGTEE